MTSKQPDIPTKQVVVLERQPYWQPELERQFLHQELVVKSCRSVDDLDDLTRTETPTVAVVDLDVDPPGTLRWLARRLTAGPDVSTIVVVTEERHSLHWHIRELGAVAVVSEYLEGNRLARLCRKSLDVMRGT